MIDIEHPDITRTRNTGYPDKERSFKCLICGMECETVYLDADGDMIACEECVTIRRVEDYFND